MTDPIKKHFRPEPGTDEHLAMQTAMDSVFCEAMMTGATARFFEQVKKMIPAEYQPAFHLECLIFAKAIDENVEK